MKVAILCDNLAGRGGAERVVLALATTFNADVYTGFAGNTYLEFRRVKIRIIGSNFRPSFLNALYLWEKFSRFRIKEKYDVFLFSGNLCISASHQHKPAIWYCHTPNRLLYVDRERHSQGVRKLTNRLLYTVLQPRDQAQVWNFDKIIANSNNVKDRIGHIYGQDILQRTRVICPPVDVHKFKWISQEDFYLSTARLHPLKRVDLIVRAFQQLPDKKLIVISSGPDLKKIRHLAQEYDNIEVRGTVDDLELVELIGRCIATIYIPKNEDFGISPVEGMAAGKPCIGVAEGGLLETIIHGETGYLCPAGLNEEALIDALITAVRIVDGPWALERRARCEAYSRGFSKERFVKEFMQELETVLSESYPKRNG